MRDLENDVVPLLATAPRLCDIRGERGAAAPSRVLTRVLLLRAHSSLSVLPLCKGTFQLFSTFFSKRYRSGCFDRWISIFIPFPPPPLSSPVPYTYPPRWITETEERKKCREIWSTSFPSTKRVEHSLLVLLSWLPRVGRKI